MTLARLFTLPLELLVRAYQLLISPMLPPSCRFYPSCSAYALTALRRFGPIRGTWLAVTRVARCHPWNPGGVDHVPERGRDGRPTHRGEEDWPSDPREASSGVTQDHVAAPRVDTVMREPGERQGTIEPGS